MSAHAMTITNRPTNVTETNHSRNVSETSQQRPAFVVYHIVKVREIIMFIGKPMGRSIMISNATNPLSHSKSAHVRTRLEARVHAHRVDRTPKSEDSSPNTTNMENTRKQNVRAGMGKTLAGRFWACTHEGHTQVWRAHARNRYAHTKGGVDVGVAEVDCVAGYVCGNMCNAQSKACAGRLYVDHLGYCSVAQVGSRCA